MIPSRAFDGVNIDIITMELPSGYFKPTREFLARCTVHRFLKAARHLAQIKETTVEMSFGSLRMTKADPKSKA